MVLEVQARQGKRVREPQQDRNVVDDGGGTVVAVSEGTNRRLAGGSELRVSTSVRNRRQARFAGVCMCVCMWDPSITREGNEREIESGWTNHCRPGCESDRDSLETGGRAE